MEETLHPAEQAANLLQNLTVDYHLAKPGDEPEVMLQHQKVQDGAGKALGVSPKVAVPGSSTNGSNGNTALSANLLYAPNGYARSAYYYGGNDGPVGNWGGNPQYANADGMEIPPRVNASGQFCGVAEMVGPVDFNKNVDYWQQDKWSGSFLVKWHIIKDVSNSQLRHIILENNEKKSVTNSRDTQEVELEQGTEMLNIFKNCVCKTSLLDDFPFYESRQKSMQEKRTRQQNQQHYQQPPQLKQKVFFQSGSEFDQGSYEGAILKAQDENLDETVFEDKNDTKSKSRK